MGRELLGDDAAAASWPGVVLERGADGKARWHLMERDDKQESKEGTCAYTLRPADGTAVAERLAEGARPEVRRCRLISG